MASQQVAQGVRYIFGDDSAIVTEQIEKEYISYFLKISEEEASSGLHETQEERCKRFYDQVVSKPAYRGEFWRFLNTIKGILQETANDLAHGSTYIKRRLNVPQMMQIVDILQWSSDDMPSGKISICMFPVEACKLKGDHDHNCKFYHFDENIIRIIIAMFEGIILGFGPK
jgi:hypothetical protein